MLDGLEVFLHEDFLGALFLLLVSAFLGGSLFGGLPGSFGLFGLLPEFLFSNGGVEHKGDALGVNPALSHHLLEGSGGHDLIGRAETKRSEVLVVHGHPAAGHDSGADLLDLLAIRGSKGALVRTRLSGQFGDRRVHIHGDGLLGFDSGDLLVELEGFLVVPRSGKRGADRNVLGSAAEFAGLFDEHDFVAAAGGFKSGGKAGEATANNKDTLGAALGESSGIGKVALLHLHDAHVDIVSGHHGEQFRSGLPFLERIAVLVLEAHDALLTQVHMFGEDRETEDFGVSAGAGTAEENTIKLLGSNVGFDGLHVIGEDGENLHNGSKSAPFGRHACSESLDIKAPTDIGSVKINANFAGHAAYLP